MTAISLSLRRATNSEQAVMEEQKNGQDQHVLDHRERINAMSDRSVRTAFRASEAKAGDPWRDALMAAMRERLRRLAFSRPDDLAETEAA